MVTVSRYDDLDALIDDTANRCAELLSQIHADPHGGINGDGVARIVLTGGTAGIRCAAALRERQVDFSRVHVFFGDERNVAPTHADSNEGQARDALLDHVAIPPENIHGFGLDGGVMHKAADAYERTINEVAPHGFDLHLLGMGGEGHINSLFPHSAAVRETQRLVIAVSDSPKPPAERVSLTLPAVARAERVWLLVSGAEKAEAAAHVARGAAADDWPAAGASGRSETILHVTEDAAASI